MSLRDTAVGGAVARAGRSLTHRPALRRAYETLVAAEIAAATAWASRRSREAVAPADLTLVVKTFERPDVLRRMLASVRRVYSGPIIVADDSHVPYVADDPGVTVLALPFDTGVGAGRNALLDAVRTEFVWMADDDMILLPDFDVARPLVHLRSHPEVDLYGGGVVNLPDGRRHDYSSAALFARPGTPLRPRGTLIGGLPVYEKVPNFYVARTDRVRSLRYDDRLKRLDHNDFFTRALGRLLCVCDRDWTCLHAHSFFDPDYLAFRQDTAADAALLATIWSGHDTDAVSPDGLAAPARTTFHRAALERVADDLGIRLVHVGGPDDPVEARVSGDDARVVGSTLASLGWAQHGGTLTHPLWGPARLAVAEGVEGVPAEFAGVPGLAGESGRWPEPGSLADAGVGTTDEPGPDAGVRWHPRAAWLVTDDAVLGAPLPLGPVFTLATPGDVLWEVVGRRGRPQDEAVRLVVETFPDAPPEAAEQVDALVEVLVARGLFERFGAAD